MKIFVSGTIAYDIILDYSGRFADHIHPEKVHVLSVSFPLTRAERTFGGTGANIAYNLAMLGTPVALLGSIGPDGKELLRRYKNMSIDIKLLRVSKKHGTSAAYIMTDRDDNQIAGFYPGAMMEPVALPLLAPCDWPIIAAENPANMVKLARHYQKTKHRYIFDPGQQVIAFSKKDLAACLRGASMVIGNDYEMDILERNSPYPLFNQRGGKGRVLIRTLGPKGSEIMERGRKVRIGIAKPKRVVDPTGAGDAYRAGLIKGMTLGLDLKHSAQAGAAAASFAIEKYGTQNHVFNYDILKARHNRNFREKI